MNYRIANQPKSVIIIAWLFIAAGSVGFVYHVTEFNTQDPFNIELLWVLLLRLLAIAGGILVLRGKSWARWLLVFWIVYHTLFSLTRSTSEFVTHGIILLLVTYILLRQEITAYFKRAK